MRNPLQSFLILHSFQHSLMLFAFLFHLRNFQKAFIFLICRITFIFLIWKVFIQHNVFDNFFVSARILILMSLFDGLLPSILCRIIEKKPAFKEETERKLSISDLNLQFYFVVSNYKNFSLLSTLAWPET